MASPVVELGLRPLIRQGPNLVDNAAAAAQSRANKLSSAQHISIWSTRAGGQGWVDKSVFSDRHMRKAEQSGVVAYKSSSISHTLQY